MPRRDSNPGVTQARDSEVPCLLVLQTDFNFKLKLPHRIMKCSAANCHVPTAVGQSADSEATCARRGAATCHVGASVGQPEWESVLLSENDRMSRSRVRTSNFKFEASYRVVRVVRSFAGRKLTTPP